MIRWQSLILFYFILFLSTDISYAAGIIYRVQQIKAMRRNQAQQNQNQQQGGQEQNQQAATQKTYQQTVDDRNQAIAQAILEAHSQSVSNANQEISDTQGQQQVSALDLVAQRQVAAPTGSTDVKDEVDLTEVWKKLDQKSTVWPALIDDQAKVLTVSEYIGRFQKQGVKINEPPEHYVQVIDQITGANPQLLQRPFGELIQIAAIVDYDFDNGIDKDALARKVLGDAGFETNKKRFSQ